MSEFNQKPEQCIGCPASQEKIDGNGVVLTRNCDGPSYKGETYQSRTTVEDGEVVDIDRSATGSYLGKAACRNRGFNLWLNSVQSQFEEATAK